MKKLSLKIHDLVVFVIFLVPIVVLIGWVTNNITLTRIFPQFTPMNPMTAVSFILIAVCLYLQRRGETKLEKICTFIVGLFLVGLGGGMLLKYISPIDLGFDRLLFVSKLGINRMAPTTSFNLLLIGLFFLLQKKLNFIKQIFIIIVLGISIYTLLAYLYNFVGVYGRTLYNPMALHTAILFLLVSLEIWFRDNIWNRYLAAGLRRRGIYVGTVIGITFLISIVIVGGIWSLFRADIDQQSKIRFENQANEITSFIDSRMNLYINTIYGVQGLFAASHSVEENEWQAYVGSLDIPSSLSGVSGISYIERIASNDVNNFPYPIYPHIQKDYYYPLTYITSFSTTTNTKSAALGFDYSSDPDRNQTLQTAINMDEPIATPVILGVTNKVPLFSVYGPIYNNALPADTLEERQQAVKGIVSVSFRLDKIFPDLMKSPLFDTTMDVLIYDASNTDALSSTTLLATTDNGFSDQTKTSLVETQTISIAGRTWTVKYVSLLDKNLPSVEQQVPKIVLITGSFLSLFIALIAGLYIRSREKELIGKNVQLEALVKNFPYGLYIEDADGKIVLTNEKLFQAFNLNGNIPEFQNDDIQNIRDAIKPVLKDYIGFMNRVGEIQNAHEVVADEKIGLTNGSYVAQSYIPLYYSNEFHGGVWIYKNITEEEKISQMKSDFVSLVSHQLKTPVAQIKGYVENMLDGLTGKVNKKQTDYLTDMLSVANKNSKLIDDLLNISRIERGILKIELEDLDANELLKDVLAPLRTVAQNKGVKLTEKLLKGAVIIKVDSVKAREAIRNIVDNALKFTEAEKAVSVSANETPTSVEIAVKDEGSGVDADVQKELFEKDRVWSGKVKASGAGLGLFLSKQFIELMGGTISFKTQAGKGTTFIITLQKSHHEIK